MELPENTVMNKYAIKLIESKQLFHESIYALYLVKLETLKTYIEIHLKTGFICSFKSLVEAPILFDKKLDGSFRLYVNYRGLNNLIIKNWYCFSLIDGSLDCFGWAKQFTQLDLTSTYH